MTITRMIITTMSRTTTTPMATPTMPGTRAESRYPVMLFRAAVGDSGVGEVLTSVGVGVVGVGVGVVGIGIH